MVKLALDFDGVIADSSAAVIRAVRLLYGIELQPEHLFTHNLKEILGVPEEEVYREAFAKIDNIPSIPYAVTNVRLLQKDTSLDVCIATSRKESEPVEEWLTRYDITVPVIYLAKDGVLPYVDFMLDDYPTKMLQYRDNIGKAFLFNQPWNERCLNISGWFERVQSWPHFMWRLREGLKKHG